MKSKNVAPVLLLACALAATACDNGPMQVVEPSLSPSFAAITQAERDMSFNENFNLNVKKPSLLEGTGAAPLFSNGAVIFQGGTDRGYLRTIASNYNTTSFKADITMTIVGGFPDGGAAIAYFGFGRGEPNCGFYCEPASDPSIYARVMPDEFYGPNVEITNAAGGLHEQAALASGEGGNGTHRLRITWNHITSEFTVFIQTDYVEGTEFIPTAVLGPIAVPGYFNATNSRIFFGGAGNVTFDNLRVVAYKPKA